MEFHVERWLSVEEIAKHLGVSRETIYRWLEAGKIPAHKVGRQWKFKVSLVDDWVLSGGADDSGFKKRKNEYGQA